MNDKNNAARFFGLLLQSIWFEDVCHNLFRLTGGRNRVEQFTNSKGGQRIATSLGATAWGRGCDITIIDDPLSADQALSDRERSYANSWIDGILRSRLNNPTRGLASARYMIERFSSNAPREVGESHQEESLDPERREPDNESQD